jgi:hypothetical protein
VWRDAGQIAKSKFEFEHLLVFEIGYWVPSAFHPHSISFLLTLSPMTPGRHKRDVTRRFAEVCDQ